MMTDEPTRVRPLRTAGKVTSAICGGFLVLVGLVVMLGAVVAGPRGLGVMGLIFGLSGLVLLPPVASALRQRIGWLRPRVAPPLAATGLFLLANCSAILALPQEQHRPDSPLRRTEAKQEVRSDPKTEVRRLIQTGTAESTTEAMTLMDRTYGQRRINADPELKALYADATTAADAAMSQDRASDYAERARGPWIDAIKAIPVSETQDAPEIWRRVNALEETARQIEEGQEFGDTGQASAARDQLKATLIDKQRVLLPVLRRSYGNLLDRLLWEQDTDVIVQGEGSQVIRFVSAIFAANRNIARAQEGALPNVRKLRFRRTQYEWYRGSEFTFYNLETPDDGAVGHWENGNFVRVD